MIKVSSVRFHQGVQITADVKTGIDAKVNESEMELNPAEGLFIRKFKGKTLPLIAFVPTGMINVAFCDPDSVEKYLQDKQCKAVASVKKEK